MKPIIHGVYQANVGGHHTEVTITRIGPDGSIVVRNKSTGNLVTFKSRKRLGRFLGVSEMNT